MSDKGRKPVNGSEVVRFLDHHRLSHQPNHYAFAHAYLAGMDARLREAVDQVTDDGVRLTEAHISQLGRGENSSRVASTLRRLMPEIDHAALRMLDIVGDALAATRDYTRSLVDASTSLTTIEQMDVPALVAVMLARAEQAEQTLADTARRVRDLRSELRLLQDDDRCDPLTGLPDRQAIEERLAARAPSGICLALVDVTALRLINEGHGHAVGDRLLKAVAVTLVEACAPHMVGRWEGGTFAVLFDRVDLAEASEILAAACTAVADKRMRVRETDAPLGAVKVVAGIAASRLRAAGIIAEAASAQLRLAKERRHTVAAERRMVTVP